MFEGLDGSGQTTQAHLLTRWFLEKQKQLAYYTKEPTEGPVGSLLKLALNKRLVCHSEAHGYGPMNETTMALLFAADRADHLNNEINPKLQDGVHVISDRYYLSSLAYQSVGADYEWIKLINRNFLRPDLTFFLDVPPEVCFKRMQAQRWHMELYEDLVNLKRVRANFEQAISDLKQMGEQIVILDGNQPVQDVHRMIVQETKKLMATMQEPRLSTSEVQVDVQMEAQPFTEREIAAHQEG